MGALAGERQREGFTVETRVECQDKELAIRYRDHAIRLSLQGYFTESESYSREALRLRGDDVDILNEETRRAALLAARSLG